MSDDALTTAVQETIAAFEALAMCLFYEDHEQALRLPSRLLHDHVPYKMWADTYYPLRTSLQAQTAVKWHIKRLSQLGGGALQSSPSTTSVAQSGFGEAAEAGSPVMLAAKQASVI